MLQNRVKISEDSSLFPGAECFGFREGTGHGRAIVDGRDDGGAGGVEGRPGGRGRRDDGGGDAADGRRCSSVDGVFSGHAYHNNVGGTTWHQDRSLVLKFAATPIPKRNQKEKGSPGYVTSLYMRKATTIRGRAGGVRWAAHLRYVGNAAIFCTPRQRFVSQPSKQQFLFRRISNGIQSVHVCVS